MEYNYKKEKKEKKKRIKCKTKTEKNPRNRRKNFFYKNEFIILHLLKPKGDTEMILIITTTFSPPFRNIKAFVGLIFWVTVSVRYASWKVNLLYNFSFAIIYFFAFKIFFTAVKKSRRERQR